MTSKVLSKADITSKVEVFKQSPSFAHLDEGALNEIACLATPLHFAKGEFIFHEGDPADICHVIQQGRVRLFKGCASGKNITIVVARPGETICANVLFNAKSRCVSAQAIDEVTVLRIRGEEFLSFVAKHRSVSLKINCILAEQLQGLTDRLMDLAVDSVERRVVCILYALYVKFGTTLFFTCEELADMAGATRESTTKVIGQLKKSGIICSARGKTIILDETGLQRLNHGSYLI